MHVQVMKYAFIKPISWDWATLAQVLREMQDQVWKIKNRTIQLAWEWEGVSNAYRAQHGVSPQPKDILGRTLDGYIYSRLTSEFPRVYTGNLSQSIRLAIRRWKTDVKDIMRGEKSIPSYRRNGPIDLHGNAIKLEMRKDGYYVCRISLLSRFGVKETGLSQGNFELRLEASSVTQKAILKRILTGEYELSSSQIVYRKKKWFLSLAYKFEPKPKSLDPEKILGVDLGIRNAVYLAFNDSPKRFCIKGGETKKFRRGIEARRKDILRQGPYSGRKGHGRRSILKPTEILSHKIGNFRNTVNHRYSLFVVNIAIKNGCGTIQMEDLKGVGAGDRFLGKWTYYDLQQKIEYKAEQGGIKVTYIDPAYTSQRCSKCGYIHRGNRPLPSMFKCGDCGYEVDADYNAAKNIATRDIAQIIGREHSS